MARILYQIPDCLRKWIYPEAIWRLESDSAKQVFLTFDDGPIPEVTPQVLDILDQAGVKATFFWVGENLTKYPHLAEEVLRRGHRVGNHTYHHIPGWGTPTKAYQSEILLTQQKMEEIVARSGVDTTCLPKLFRPPYGKAGYAMHSWLRDEGYKVILWDVVSHDYNRHYKPERIVRIVMKYTRPGSVLLMHDSLKSQDNILAALPIIIRRLQLQGYDFALL